METVGVAEPKVDTVGAVFVIKRPPLTVTTKVTLPVTGTGAASVAVTVTV